MSQTWSELIKEAMSMQEMTQKELADKLGVSLYQLRHSIIEEERVTLEQLDQLVKILHLDLEKFLASSTEEHQDLLLEDDVQIRLNQIARTIPQQNRAQFLKALTYLAQCFKIEE